ARPGETLNYKINITNPFDCTLNPVKVVDEVAPSGVRTSLVNALGGQKSGNTITWNNVGPIAPHASKTVPVSVLVAPDSPAGVVAHRRHSDGARGGVRPLRPAEVEPHYVLTSPPGTAAIASTSCAASLGILGSSPEISATRRSHPASDWYSAPFRISGTMGKAV